MIAECVQLSPGLLQEGVVRIDMEPATLRRYSYSVGISETISARPETVTVAYLARQFGPARLNGEPWAGHRVALLFGPAEFATTEPAVLVTVEVPLDGVPILREAMASRGWTTQNFALLSAADPTARSIRELVESTFSQTNARLEGVPSVRRRLIALILRAADAVDVRGRQRRKSARDSVVDAARAYMWSHINDEIGLQEICKGIGCGSRTLINYFQALYGVSPIRFMRLLRLNRVRRALTASDPRTTAIFDVAADFGFWHMGHFTTNYRALFGETPTETLTGASMS